VWDNAVVGIEEGTLVRVEDAPSPSTGAAGEGIRARQGTTLVHGR